MLLKYKLLYLLMFFLLFSSVGFSQSKGRFTVPNRGILPIQKNGSPLIVSVIRTDIQIIGSVRFRAEGMELWSAYYVYQEMPEHYYLGLPSRGANDLGLADHIGWVEKQYVLDSSEALRTPNKIYRRIIVFDNRYQNRVNIYSAPLHKAEEISKTPLFSFFYIYKETQDYYLIGVAPRIEIEDTALDLLGWIHKKNCREWNTRLAISYKKDNQPFRLSQENSNKEGLVRIYKTLDDAIQKNSTSIIAKETEASEWRYNMLRYPLLESESNQQKRLFQIAFLSGDKSDDTQKMISKIKEEKEKLNKLDIMFLIDSSLGSPTRQKIVEAIEKSQESLKPDSRKKSEALDVAWGLTFFHDFEKEKKYPYRRGRLFEPSVVNIYDFTSNIEKLVRNINNQPYHGYRYEAKSLYYGLDMALHKKARWREGSTRILFVVGATGNHEKDSPRDITQLINEDIKTTLQKEGVRVYGIHFEEKPAESKLRAVQDFSRNILDLAEKMGEGGYFLVSAATDDYREKTFSMLHLLRLLFEHYLQEVSLFDQVLSDMGRGFPPEEVEKRYGENWKDIWTKFNRLVYLRSIEPLTEGNSKTTIFIPQLKNTIDNFLLRHEIKLEDLKEKGIFYDKGWVWEINPTLNVQQIQVWLLIDQMELSRLIGFLSSLLLQLKNASNPQQYMEIWKTLLKATFGIDTIPSSEPLDNLIMQHTGLPFMNGLLNYTLDDFVQKARTGDFRRTVIEKLETTCNLLFMVLQEKEIEQIMTPQGITINQSRKRWWSEAGSDLKYSWLEVEMFP
ncbi:MAG: hypothetical protein HUU50_21800 [Candidatus Brocadiae bacterium]|nr:hypothetical protein [Candidatus Brocadiia bacterium]